MSIENGEHQSLNSTPAREPMRRMGGDEAIKHGGNLQTSQDAKHQRPMGDGMHRLYRRGHDIPPVVPPADRLCAPSRRLPELTVPLGEKSLRFNLTPRTWGLIGNAIAASCALAHDLLC